MSCDRAQKLMVLADSLSEKEQAEFQRHLQECEICNSEWLKWQRFFALLSQLPIVSSTLEERTEVMRALQNVLPVPDLNCASVKSQIWRWIDGDLSKDEVASLIVHLANCDHCQSALWQAEQTIQLLRSLSPLKATMAEKEALKARLKRMGKRSTVVPFVWRVAFPIAAAAAILLFFALSLLQTPQVDDQVRIVHSVSTQPAPTIKPQPTEPRLIVPKVTRKPQAHRYIARLPQKPEVKTAISPKQVSQPKPSHKVKAKKPVDERVLTAVQIDKPKSEPEKPKPKPIFNETTTVVTKAPGPETPVAVKMPEPETRQLPAVSVPSELAIVPIKVEPSIAAIGHQMPQALAIAQIEAQPRQLVTLPPVTIDAELPIEPPRIKLTVIPPSQRLYQQSGVAFVTVPPEKRPIKPPEEKALTPDLSIPLAAERYRSHTATIPFFRFGISW